MHYLITVVTYELVVAGVFSSPKKHLLAHQYCLQEYLTQLPKVSKHKVTVHVVQDIMTFQDVQGWHEDLKRKWRACWHTLATDTSTPYSLIRSYTFLHVNSPAKHRLQLRIEMRLTFEILHRVEWPCAWGWANRWWSIPTDSLSIGPALVTSLITYDLTRTTCMYWYSGTSQLRPSQHKVQLWPMKFRKITRRPATEYWKVGVDLEQYQHSCLYIFSINTAVCIYSVCYGTVRGFGGHRDHTVSSDLSELHWPRL